jgi:HlyD family secretion protein
MTAIDQGSLYGLTAAAPSAREAKPEKTFSMRGRVLLGAVFGILLLGGVGGWAATAKLSSAVIGQGTVLVDEDLKVVQHIDGGIVREINVRQGDRVQAGQVLLRLDDSQLRAENAILTGQLLELRTRAMRLVAEREDSSVLEIPEAFLTQFPQAASIAAGETQLFESNLSLHLAQIEQMELQLGQLQQEIIGLEAQQRATQSEFELASAEQVRMRELADRQLIQAAPVAAAERDVVRLQGALGEVEAAIARANSRISELRSRVIAVDTDRRTVAQRELRLIEAQIAETEERLRAAHERLERVDILAPVSGIVNELAVTTVGGVISPAEHLVTIVPDDADLTIEFRVAINDIDQVAVGKDVTMRFSAFNQRVTPEVDGVVTRVGAAAQFDANTGQSYYLAVVELTDESTESWDLVPGMPVEVFVQTEEQPALSYLMKPISDQVARAFREE